MYQEKVERRPLPEEPTFTPEMPLQTQQGNVPMLKGAIVKSWWHATSAVTQDRDCLESSNLATLHGTCLLFLHSRDRDRRVACVNYT